MRQFLNRKISVYRLEDIGGNRQAYTTFTTTLECAIQPLGAEKTAQAGGSFGKMFVLYMDADKDVKDGDKFLDDDGNWYEAVSGGVDNRNDGFMADYLSIMAKKVNG